MENKTFDYRKENKLLKYVLITGFILALGIVSGVFAGSYMKTTASLPVFSPPYIFAVIMQPICYFLIGTSIYLTYAAENVTEGTSSLKKLSSALNIVQTGLLVVLPFLFNMLNAYTAAFIVAAIISAFTLAIVLLNIRISKWAAISLVPYMLYITYIAIVIIQVSALN